MDSSSLIFAFKVPRIYALVSKRYGKIVIPQAVFDETVTAGKLLGKPEVQSIEGEIRKGNIILQTANAVATESIESGEREAIGLARALKLPLLCDDHKARVVAVSLGVQAIPLSALLLWAVRNRKMTGADALACLDLLVGAGYRLKLDVYLILRKEIER